MAEGAADAPDRPLSIDRKPTPGPNSWAQSQSQIGLAPAQQSKPRPTNRDKYENKPMPNLPSELENPKKSVKLPAIPILMPPDNPRTRAVTDPLDSSYALGGRKPSVTQLRKRFGHSKQNSDSSTSNAPVPTGKAAEVLGIGPKRLQKAKVPTLTTQAPDELDNDSSIIIMQSERPLSENAEPQQNRQPASEVSERSREASASPGERQQSLGDREVGDLAIEVAKKTPQDHSARLAPAKIGSYARIGEVGMLQGQGLVRIESVQGIIDHANPQYAKSEISERDSEKELDNEATPRSSSQSQYSAGLLKPVSYSPNDYAGVWENDPAVGYSLPPFSPFPRDVRREADAHAVTSSRNGRGAGSPSIKESFHGHTNDGDQASRVSSESVDKRRFLGDQRPRPGLANSWANSTSNDSSMASRGDPLSALLPPYWPHHTTNSVPSPPQSQQDYQRQGDLAASLSQLDLTIHHHLDSAFGSLARLITDKHDRLLDHVLRRLDDVDDRLEKAFKGTRGEIRDVSHELALVKGAFNNFSQNHEDVKEAMQAIEAKIGVLRVFHDQNMGDPRLSVPVPTGGNDADEGQPQQPRTDTDDGAVSADKKGSPFKRRHSRKTSKARSNKTSQQSQPSQAKGSQSANAINEAVAIAQAYPPDFGVHRGPPPDIRGHPAYSGPFAGAPQMYEQHGVPIAKFAERPSYPSQRIDSGNWYQKAYGPR